MKTLRSRPRSEIGFTLIEMMISITLGVILVGGVISVVVANGQAYRTNEGLSQIQESSRTAFELLARDIREAGATGCGNGDRIANTLNNTSDWWQAAWTGVRGYDGATASPNVEFGNGIAQRVAGTDALMLQGIAGNGITIDNHDPTSAVIKINQPSTNFRSNDILIVCDTSHAAIFQVTNYNAANVTVAHNTGTGTVGNCSKGLGFPTNCSSTNGNTYKFGRNAQIASLYAVTWYIGNNGRPGEGGRSLYRTRLGSAAGSVTEEIVPGITNVVFTFRPNDSAATLTATPANWNEVTAVQIRLTTQSTDVRVTTAFDENDGRLSRDFTSIIGLRNRLP